MATLLGVAFSGGIASRDHGDDFSAVFALNLLPLALLPWAVHIADVNDLTGDFFGPTVVVIAAFCSTFAANAWLAGSGRWRAAQSVHYYVIAFALIGVTLFRIEREAWAIAFELLALSYLAFITALRSAS